MITCVGTYSPLQLPSAQEQGLLQDSKDLGQGEMVEIVAGTLPADSLNPSPLLLSISGKGVDGT